MKILIGSLWVAFVLWLAAPFMARADHERILPLVPNTPAIQNLLADGERTWCVNAALNNYPNAVTQLQQTYDSQAEKLGNSNRQIPGTFESVTDAKNAGCEVWWNGRYDNFCSGCACNVFYASWPVTVNVKLSLGYFDYKSCFGHEEGHIHGLGEFYKDQSGNIGCDAGYQAMIIRLGFPTVMSCGTLVWELQPNDISLICDAIYGAPGDRFHACAPTEVWGVPLEMPCCPGEYRIHNAVPWNVWFWQHGNLLMEWADAHPHWYCRSGCE